MSFEDMIKFATEQSPAGMMVIAAGWILWSVEKFLPKVKRHKFWARIEPTMAILLCSVFVWIPGARPDETIAQRIFVGISLGGIVHVAFKIWHQTFRGRDDRISGEK